MSMRISKSLKYIFYMAGVILLILVIFNVVFTLLVHNRLKQVVTNPGRWPQGAYVYDQEIGFDFATGISGPIGDGSFYVKSHHLGYRIGRDEDAEAWQPGGVLSLGCSFTYGDEVESEQTFTNQLAGALKIPAYNYGICSFSYTHALLKARELKEAGVLDRLQPRLVVLGCWTGLPDRSRSPFPPLASDNLPLPSAYLAKDNGTVVIHPPMDLAHVFGMVEMYREKGPGLSPGKFARLFTAAPGYVYLYLRNNRLAQQVKFDEPQKELTDHEVYDFYFSGIEEVFSDYGSQIVVLFMPNTYFNEKPSDALLGAVAEHPGIRFVDGYEAIRQYDVPARDYVRIHPQPRAHLAYALGILNALAE